MVTRGWILMISVTFSLAPPAGQSFPSSSEIFHHLPEDFSDPLTSCSSATHSCQKSYSQISNAFIYNQIHAKLMAFPSASVVVFALLQHVSIAMCSCDHADEHRCTCAVRPAVVPKPGGGAKQHLRSIQGESLFTGEETLGAEAEVPQRMGAVHRQGYRRGPNGFTLHSCHVERTEMVMTDMGSAVRTPA